MSTGRDRFLHVANGTSTTRTIAAAGIPGPRSIWADPLYEGPVPGGLSDAELLAVRGQYLAGLDEPEAEPSADSGPARDPVNDLREWRAAIERRQSYDELLLWFEHDLFDQLNLIQLLTWIRERVASTTPVSLICIGSFPGRPDFKGLGELRPDELSSLLEARQSVTEAQYDLAARAWQAFRAPSPEPLDMLRQKDTSALPYLGAALGRFLEEFPWTRDGLSRTERRLLELADGDGIALSAAFPRMHDGERAYYVTDGSLSAIAAVLAGTTPALLTLDVPSGASASPLPGRVTLTSTGRSVLSGTLDRIAACGIDRWLGGVHLTSEARLWRWDTSRRRIV